MSPHCLLTTLLVLVGMLQAQGMESSVVAGHICRVIASLAEDNAANCTALRIAGACEGERMLPSVVECVLLAPISSDFIVVLCFFVNSFLVILLRYCPS